MINWQVGSIPAEIVIGVGVPTVGVILTVWIICADGPLHPLANTWMLTLPENPFAQVITPVVVLIDPARALLSDQLKPALLAAVVA